MFIDERSTEKPQLDIASSKSESDESLNENKLSVSGIDAKAKVSQMGTESHSDDTNVLSVQGSSEDTDENVEFEKILDTLLPDNQLNRAVEDKLIELVTHIVHSRLPTGKMPQTLRSKLFKYLRSPVHNFYDRTLLYEAIQENDIERVNDLLEENSDINGPVVYNRKNCGMLTALGAAVKLNREDIVQLLLDRESCDVNAAAESGLTPLHISALKNNQRLAEILISKGATIDVYSKYQSIFSSSLFRWTVIENLVFNESNELYKVLRMNRIMEHLDGVTALHVATKANNLEMVELLLDHGADINARCLDRGNGYAALHYAVMNNNIEMVNLLLDRGANVDVKSSDGKAILHLAVETGHEIIVLRLLDVGANINIRSNTDCFQDITPVLEACSRKHTTIMSLLIEKGADLSAMCVCNSTSALVNITDFILELRFFDPLGRFSYFAIYNLLRHDRTDRTVNPNEIIRHIFKSRAVGYTLDSELLMELRCHEENFETFKSECQVQVEKMKEEKIEGTNVYYYDLFFKNVYQMATYAKNKSIEKAMTLSNLNAKFPLYAHTLMDSFDKGRKRNQLLKKVAEDLEDVFINLPYDCVSQILIHLSNENLLIYLRKTRAVV